MPFGAIASLIGAGIGASSSKSNTKANIRHQREFAQKGIRWRVSDAKKAGIHPLYALGASTPSFSPVHSDAPAIIGDGIAGAGEAIQRSMDDKKQRSLAERVADSEIAVNEAQAQLITAQSRTLAAQAKASLQNRTSGVNYTGETLPPAFGLEDGIHKLPREKRPHEDISLTQTDIAPDGTAHTFPRGEDFTELLLSMAKMGWISARKVDKIIAAKASQKAKDIARGKTTSTRARKESR